MKKPKVSIIIRTKNEERWISSCLRAVLDQSYKDFEIIIVDNNSNDKTVEKAKNFRIKKVINIDDYLPGKALNLGIEKSNGEYFVCLSAHCIPTGNDWLKILISSIEEDEIYAGVFNKCYGIECIGLRYFNVFGPRQDPNGVYAAVIPKFIFQIHYYLIINIKYSF